MVATLLVIADRAFHKACDAVKFVARAWLPCVLTIGADTVRAVDHNRQAHPFDLWLVADQGAHGLADFKVGGLLLPRFLRAGAFPSGIRVWQIVLYRDGAGRFGAFVRVAHALRAAGHLPIRIVAFLGLVQPIEAHAHRGFRAHMPGAEAALQHFFDRACHPEFCGMAHLLSRQRGRGLSYRLASSRQQVAARIDDGDVLWAQTGDGRGDQAEDRLYALAIQSAHAGRRQHDAGLRLLAVAREGLAARQHQVNAHATNALHGTKRARDLALQRACFVDFLLEFGGGEAVTAVEYLVADRTTGRQPLLGQGQAGIRHLIGSDQDLGAIDGDAVRDVPARELVSHLGRITQVQVPI